MEVHANKGQPSGYCELDSTGWVPLYRYHPRAIVSVYQASSEEEQLGFDAWEGDWCIRNDTSQTFIHLSSRTHSMADWMEIKVMGSVVGKIGADSVLFTPAGNIDSTTVGAAIRELDTEKSPALLIPPAADDTYMADAMIRGIAGESIAQWDVVYPKNASGTLKWYKYDCNGADKEKPARAMAVAAIAQDATGILLLRGVVRNNGQSMTSNQDEGKNVYASGTAGAITLTRPSTTGDEVQILGFVLEENVIRFDPCPVLVEVA